MLRARDLFFAALFALSAAACPSSPARPPALGQDVTRVGSGGTRPLIVEWPSSDRAELEALARRGLVAVRYDGSEMLLLPACTVSGAYAYGALTPKKDRITIHDTGELRAKVPIGAAKLEGVLRRKGELNVEMTVVGRFEASSIGAANGDCRRATHVVSALTVGAFDFFAGAGEKHGGDIGAAGASAGGSASSEREVLNRDGDDAACTHAAASDRAPPYGCGAVMRVDLVAFPDAPPHAAPTPYPPAPGGARPAPEVVASGAMVRIPGSTFRWNGEQPVRVASFELDTTKVTVAAFRACVAAGQCVPPASADNFCNWSQDGKAQHPINCVTWEEAKTFCGWAGKRLPTEIEWQYAAIGQTGSTYPWGNEPPDDSRVCTQDGYRTCAVGRFPAGKSHFGVLDMASNTQELMLDAWCQGGLACSGPQPRGCGCQTNAHAVRSGLPATHRADVRDGEMNTNLGFRCARSLPGATTPQTCPQGTAYALDQCVAAGGKCPAGMHLHGNACLAD